MSMTKSEIALAAGILRKRERVLKIEAEEWAAKRRAEVEAQMSRIYKFDEHEVWQQATEKAKRVVAEANKEIASVCKELRILPQFAPKLDLEWWGRGENAVKERRKELREAAEARIDAMLLGMKRQIEKDTLARLTDVSAHGLQSEAAQAFLKQMPNWELLMPRVDVRKLLQDQERDQERDE
jgi:hypothetical protein